ncbi:hypothetical protein ASPCAL11527 [Aspergillus calidoustus]|uniref:RRM domain-containing protein n=1 Tax=Aspergillus calidoustus TaxID=454130 RepID=A0A0U5GCQ9_ASPCI|nr:hypothetical protein ASPCAL11527 [Aspergillus calidoustus]
MYSLRRTACRLLSSPTPLLVRSRLAAVSNPPHHIPLCRTISQSEWARKGVQSIATDTGSAIKTTATPTSPTSDAPESSTQCEADIVQEAAEQIIEVPPEVKDTSYTAAKSSASTPNSASNPSFDVDLSQIREAAAGESEAERKRLEEDSWESFRKRQSEPKETVFLGNLFYDLTAGDLKKHMSKFGVVRAANIIYDDRGISKGFGYVQFDRWQSAQTAIEAMHMKIFQGRRVTMHYSHSSLIANREAIQPSKVLYVGNMPFEMTDRDFNTLFRSINNLIDVRVSMDRRTGQFQGYLHAEFTDIKSATIALERLSLKRPYKRKLNVTFSNNVRLSKGTELVMPADIDKI